MKALRVLVGGFLSVLLALAMLAFVGMILESASEYNEAHDRCLKRATNGYDIRQCG